MPFIFNLNNCQPRKPTNICIPTLVHYLVKYERFLGVFIYSNPSVNFNAIWMIKRIDRPVACAYRVCGFFLLGKQNFANRQTGVPGQNGQGRRWEVDELMSWTGRVCYALFYVCIALKIIRFPSKWSIWNYGHPEKKWFHAQGIFLHEWKFFLYVLCCQWCCVWMLNILKISQM